MTTVIVPVDFSATSIHTAHYAAQLLIGHYGVNILLYHSYAKASEEIAARESLEQLRKELMATCIVQIEIMAQEEDNFVEGLQRAVRHRKADLVIMGISGKSALKKVLFGSNTLKMVDTKVCPIMIIPEEALFQQIRNVMLTSDFKDTNKTTPSVPIKDFLGVFNPKLHVVNVDKDHYISLTTNYEKEKQHLAQMFEEYHPEFYFMRLYDVDEALTLFAQDKGIDLLIVIRRDESFIQKIFKPSHTKAISYQSKIPILVMHE